MGLLEYFQQNDEKSIVTYGSEDHTTQTLETNILKILKIPENKPRNGKDNFQFEISHAVEKHWTTSIVETIG